MFTGMMGAAPDWLFIFCREVFAQRNEKKKLVKFSPLSTSVHPTSSLIRAQGASYCSSHLYFHPFMESALIFIYMLRVLSVTDDFVCVFVQTEMNSDVELNQISVDIATPTQDVSMSPISLVLFIRFHKNGVICHD